MKNTRNEFVNALKNASVVITPMCDHKTGCGTAKTGKTREA